MLTKRGGVIVCADFFGVHDRQGDIERMIAFPTTGYRWQLAGALGPSLVQRVSSRYAGPEDRLIGSGGREVWIFKAVGRGKTTIAMKYVRPWEKETPPVEEAIFRVEIQ